MTLPNETLKKYLTPWCAWQNKQVEKHKDSMKKKNNENYVDAEDLKTVTMDSIKEKFADEEDGAYNFIIEFASAKNESFNDGNGTNPDVVHAQVLLGLIYLADLVYQDSNAKKTALAYRIRDAIDIFHDYVMLGKLDIKEQNYLDELYKTEIPNSESDEE